MNSTILRFLAAWVAVLPPCLASAADSPEAAFPQEETDYHFFVGANLRIPHEDTYFPVERIWNAQAQIKVDNKIIAQKVSSLKEIKVDRKAKVSPHIARISDLECEPVYSVGRDPRTLAAQQQMMAQSMASAFTDQVDSSLKQSANPSAFRAPPSSGINTDVAGNFDTQLEADQSAALNFSNASETGDIETGGNRPMWDMLHVQFSISADQFFPSAHLVFIFQLAETEEGDPVMSWFHFLSLTDISPEPKSYDYRLAAYPDGMYIASKEAFLFTNGTEIATNLSSKHVPMKQKDARTFLKYQYITENSGKSRPPDRAWRYLDPNLRNRVTPDIRDQTLTLKIDENGQVLDLKTSREVERALKPGGIHEIASLMYLPALENGKPVPGELTLYLKDVILD